MSTQPEAMKLFPYQEVGADWLASVGRGLLADDMGLGKTAQAIVAAVRRKAKTVRVICPASLVENWRREIARHDPDHLTREWHVTSYNRFTSAWRPERPMDRFDVLIIDEAHALKSKDAKRTKAIFGPKCAGVGGVVGYADAVFLLTGTPMPNHPAELWPMVRAVFPDAVDKKSASYWGFVAKYCRTIDNGFGAQIVGGKNLGDLKASIAPYVLRRKKDEVLPDLPPLRIDTLPLVGRINVPGEMNRQQFEMIQAFEQDGIEGLAKIAPHIAQLRRMTGLAKVAPVVDWVAEQVEAGLEKIVLFAHHREVIEALSEALNEHVQVVLHGGTRDREDPVLRFQHDPCVKIFIGQIQAAGTGITLTAASDLVFVESSWVPAENEQAAMRIHRIGQKNACLVRFATIADSLDEQIAKACARKLETISQVFA